MKKIITRLLPLAVLLWGVIAWPQTAMALGSDDVWSGPHALNCADCHQLRGASYPNFLGKLCQSCHFVGSPVVLPANADVKTHSSKTIAGANVARDGNWDLDCWACHNPHTQEQNIEYGSTYGKYVKNDFGTSFTSRSPTTVKEINPADTGPYYTPIGTIRTITSDEVEFKSNSGFVDNDALTEDDICQVCHANTNNYSTGAVASHSNYGPDSQPGGNCTSACHLHSAGFSGAGGDCTTCHSAAQNSTDLYRRQVVSTGGDFERAKHHVTDGSATEVVTAGDCVVCHNQADHTTWGDDPIALAGYKVSLNDLSQASGAAAITYDGTGASIEGFCLGCHNATGPHDDYDYDSSPDGINEPFSDGTDPQDINSYWTTNTIKTIGTATCTDGTTVTVINSTFDANAESFVYADNVFGGTNNSASGNWGTGTPAGNPGGRIQVVAPGAGPTTGAYQQTVSTSAGTLEITLSYRLQHAAGFEPGEYSEAVLAVDGSRLGNGASNGNGVTLVTYDGLPDSDSGWVTETFSTTVTAGNHTIQVGAYNTGTFNGEITTASFDNILVTAQTGGACTDDTVTSGGTYTGTSNGTYTIDVTTGGASGVAQLTCTSDVTGDTSCGVDTWVDNTAIPIGTLGVTLNIDDTSGGTELATTQQVQIPVTYSVSGGSSHDSAASSSLTTEACMTCHGGADSTVTETVTDHNLHGAANSYMLSGLIDGVTPTNLEEEVCFACHSATGNASTDIEGAVTTRTSSHGMVTSVHVAGEDESTMADHVQCLDCHNPHAANSTAKADSSTTTPNLPGALAGVPGIDKDGNPVTYATEEYQLCFRCHGDNAVTVTRLARVMDSGNLRVDFDTTNPTHHAVVGPGVDAAVPSLGGNWDAGDRIYCTDCHMDTSGLNGPHGSDNPYLLKARYELDDGGTGTFAEKYALCASCHSNMGTGFTTNAGVLTGEHGSGSKHGSGEGACSWCHDPHGYSSSTNPGYTGTRRSLINFRTDVVSGSQYWGGGGGRGGTGCQLTCHGRSH